MPCCSWHSWWKCCRAAVSSETPSGLQSVFVFFAAFFVPNPHQSPRCEKKNPPDVQGEHFVEKENWSHLKKLKVRSTSLAPMENVQALAFWEVELKMQSLSPGSLWCTKALSLGAEWPVRSTLFDECMPQVQWQCAFSLPLGEKKNHWEASWTLERKLNLWSLGLQIHCETAIFEVIHHDSMMIPIYLKLLHLACSKLPAVNVHLRRVFDWIMLSANETAIAQVNHSIYMCKIGRCFES